MTGEQLTHLLDTFTQIEAETEWVEFKHNNANPDDIGEYISAISNAAALHGRPTGYIAWGIESGTHRLIGTTFRPRQGKVGNEELENWLTRLLEPKVHFTVHECDRDGSHFVIFEVPAAIHTPVAFKGQEFIRVGSYKKPLRSFPEKERQLWALLSKVPFEREPAQRGLSADDVLGLLDYPSYFELAGQALPDARSGILERLTKEQFIVPEGGNRLTVTNLGAILFAKDMSAFPTIGRKAIRVILYKGISRVETQREQPGTLGYAAGFSRMIRFVNDLLPRNEVIGEALRREVPMYPPIAIRELAANAIIHQDFRMTGTGPTIEVFSDRIEFTNPGIPLIDPLRFIDEPPRSRNETLAAFMRRANICEERGSGIDKVVDQAEYYQLPAPEFGFTDNHTKTVLFAYRKWGEMNRLDRIRASYQHACLQFVSNRRLTNASLRKRFGVSDENYSMVSRVIGDTVDAKMIKPSDPDNTSRRQASYIPFWA
jgi:ATP-dependent DNA helicase RecG